MLTRVLTREEYIQDLELIDSGHPGYVSAKERAIDHDAEQRQVIEQYQVQLAGCLTAAEGATKDHAKQGEYGWSVAYQAVLELRLKYDQQAQEIANLKEELEKSTALYTSTINTQEQTIQALREVIQSIVQAFPKYRRLSTDLNGKSLEYWSPVAAMIETHLIDRAQRVLEETT